LRLLRDHPRLRTSRSTVAGERLVEGRLTTTPDALVSGVCVASLARRGLARIVMGRLADETWDGTWWAEATEAGREIDLRPPFRWRRRPARPEHGNDTLPADIQAQLEEDRHVWWLEGEYPTWVERIYTAPVDNARYRCWTVVVHGEYLGTTATRREAYARVAAKLREKRP
jgi:hypothetical protein